MNRIKFLFIFMLCHIVCLSQNIERENVRIPHVLLPYKKFPDSTETYFVWLKSATTAYANNLLMQPDAEKIKLNGYYRLSSAEDADIIVQVELSSELLYKSVNLYKREETYKKDKESPEIKYMAYTYVVKYIAPKLKYVIRTGSGEVLDHYEYGGKESSGSFGGTNYDDHYSNEYQLQHGWNESKKYLLGEWERQHYEEDFKTIPAICNSYCLMFWANTFNIRYVKEKKTNVYDDLRQAKELFKQGVSYMHTDKVELINKLIQPEYNKRIDTLSKAIAIWEKALTESNLQDKNARIDQKVTRHIYYNLSLAYALTGSFDKAQQYIQGREDEETKKTLFKNVFAGLESLSGFIDESRKRKEANKWRPLLLSNDTTYVYKDPATRQKEKNDAMKAEMARRKPVNYVAEKAAKTTALSKSAGTGKKTTAATKPVPAGTAGTSTIVITNAIFSTLNRFSELLADNPKIKKTDKSFKDGTVTFKLNYSGTMEALMSDIESKLEGNYEITGFETESKKISLKVK